jgi:DNA-binding transcriptional MerR regulator
MAKRQKKPESMGAAECARHTGLTVRALRVYERHGLIVPARSAKGWRRYGQKELTRLGTIVTLKALGLSLAKIREVLTADAPSLERVLQMQRQVWQTRQQAAEKSLAMVEAALGHLQSRQALSIAELCGIIRSVGMSMSGTWQAAARELINVRITPEEERTWATWWARRPKEEGARTREQLEVQMALMREVRVLMERDAAPTDAAVQELVERSNQNWLRYRLHERLLEQLNWNAALTRKMFAVGNQLIAQSVPQTDTPRGASAMAFFGSAIRASKGYRAIERILADVIAARARPTPSLRAVEMLVARYAALCERHSLGDPVIYARWRAAFGTMRDNEWVDLDDASKAAWDFLSTAAAEPPAARARKRPR